MRYNLLTVGAFLLAGFAHADAAVDVNGNPLVSGNLYKIVNVQSGRCLDVTDGGTANGTRIQQYDCEQADLNQSFQFGQRTDGNWVITTMTTGGMSTLDFDANTLPRNGTIVQQYHRNGNGVQHMQFTSSDSGYQITSADHPHACLDVPANQINVNGTPLQTWRCNEQPNQAFRFRPILKMPQGA